MVENLFRGHPSGEHPLHLNPFFIREIREIRGSNCCNPWFQLLFLGLIPMKSQASTNSVLRSCPQGRAEVQGGRRDRWETPRASFIPAQGNALGSSPQNPISAESATHPSSYQPQASGIKTVCLN